MYRFEPKLEVGLEAANAKDLAHKVGDCRGSLKIDLEPKFRELRDFLDDPSCQRYLGKFLKRCGRTEALSCWLDCNEYSHIPTSDFRRCKAIQIIKKYVKTDAPMKIGLLPEGISKIYVAALNKLQNGEAEGATPNLFDKVRKKKKKLTRRRRKEKEAFRIALERRKATKNLTREAPSHLYSLRAISPVTFYFLC